MILGVDFGLKNIGLAISAGELAEPLGQFKVKSSIESINQINQICRDHQITKIIIGLPDGVILTAVKKFAGRLEKSLNLPVIFQDETLTSQEAVKKSQYQSLKKRQRSQHATAAALILQSYIDSQH